MTLFERFDQRPRTYVLIALSIYMLVNGGINASSQWMEASRGGEIPEFSLWEPILWELSSMLAILILLPLLIYMGRQHPPRLSHIPQQLLKHLAASIVFSVSHVLLMVWLRQMTYHLVDGNYDFGPWLRELFYEYRKDLLTYVFILTLYHLYQFVYSRLKGEANLISSEDDNNRPAPLPEHLLVKKLDKEFLVKVMDIEWMEAAGNYVNLYSAGRIYPLRATLANTIERIKGKGFSRIHRSFAINNNAIDNISYHPSGDGEIRLKSGKVLNLSRRYKDEFKQQFG